MLHNAIERCPEEKWIAQRKFLFLSYHTLIFLEYYLTFPAARNFSPALPYTETHDWINIDGAVDDLIPAKNYTKKEILNYLHSCREKCYVRIAALDEENVHERWIDEWGNKDYSAIEILLYNMRHVQHHAAQLNMMLRREINDAPKWVGRTEEPL